MASSTCAILLVWRRSSQILSSINFLRYLFFVGCFLLFVGACPSYGVHTAMGHKFMEAEYPSTGSSRRGLVAANYTSTQTSVCAWTLSFCMSLWYGRNFVSENLRNLYSIPSLKCTLLNANSWGKSDNCRSMFNVCKTFVEQRSRSASSATSLTYPSLSKIRPLIQWSDARCVDLTRCSWLSCRLWRRN